MVRRTTEKKVHRSTREDRMFTDYRATFRDLTLMVASSITIIGTTAIAASLPKMSDAFASTSHGHFLVKVSLTLPALTAGLCAVPMGMITDRWGRKQLFVVALILYSTAGSAGFFLNSLYAILVSRLLLGVAVSAVATWCHHTHRGLHQEHRARHGTAVALHGPRQCRLCIPRRTAGVA